MEFFADRLESPIVTLEPLAEEHREGLRAAGADPEIWKYLQIPAHGDLFDKWFDWGLALTFEKQECVFAVRAGGDKRLVGSTRFLNFVPERKQVEIGHTWYVRALWGTTINPGSKYLLLCHGFETLGMERVEFQCDPRNERSRQAILRLGAKERKTADQEIPRRTPDGRITDLFLILHRDWPEVKARLEERLRQ